MRLGDPAGASRHLDRALTVAESLNAPAEVAGVRCSQACLALELQDWEQARVHAAEAIETSGLAHSMRRTTPQWVLGMVALSEGDLESAGEQFQESLCRGGRAGRTPPRGDIQLGSGRGRGPLRGAIARRRALQARPRPVANLGDPLGVVDCLVVLAELAATTEPEGAAELLGAAESLRDRAGAKATPREAAQIAAISESLGQALATEGLEAAAKMDQAEAVAAAGRIISRIETGNQ